MTRADELSKLFDLAGRVAVVTGAGSGLGQAVSIGFAEHGADLVCLDLNQGAAEATAALVRKKGRQAFASGCDVTELSQLESAVERAVDRYARIDVLFNSAGVTKRIPVQETVPDDWRWIVDVNLVGTFLACKAVGEIMMAQGKGSVINMASIAAFSGIGRGNTAYTASKGGVAALTRELAIEWASHNIRVNALAPVQIKTPLISAILDDPDTMSRLTAKIPMGRFGEPEELVGPAVFLASDASSLVTGVTLPVDGGHTAA